MNKAQMLLAAVGGLLGGYQDTKNRQYDRGIQERKLALDEIKAGQREPTSGVANFEYLKKMFPNAGAQEFMALSSPSGFSLSPGMRDYLANQEAYKQKQEIDNPRPKFDIGDDGDVPPPPMPKPVAKPASSGPSPDIELVYDPVTKKLTPAGGPKVNPETGNQVVKFDEL